MRIVIVGVGNLGSAIVRNLKRTRPSDKLLLVERNREQCAALARLFECEIVPSVSVEAPLVAGDLVLLCVKPQDAQATCGMLAPFVTSDTVVLSMMAGVTIASIAAALPTSKIVRAMPNLGASVGESATGYYSDPTLSREDLARAEGIIAALGKSWRLEREELLDVFTAVAGSGPAYLCWLGEQIEQVAVALGIAPQDAHAIALETFRGTTLYLEQSGLSFAKLREQVTSPQGTTAAALHVLDSNGADRIVRQAIEAAEKRSRELAGQ